MYLGLPERYTFQIFPELIHLLRELLRAGTEKKDDPILSSWDGMMLVFPVGFLLGSCLQMRIQEVYNVFGFNKRGGKSDA